MRRLSRGFAHRSGERCTVAKQSQVLHVVIVRVLHNRTRTLMPLVALVVREERSGLTVRLWQRSARNPMSRWGSRRIPVPWHAVARDATPREALVGMPIDPVPRAA